MTEEHPSRLPSGGVLDTDPLADAGLAEALSPDDPEAQRVKAVLEARLLGGEGGTTKIGRFTLLERAGEGGMGLVYAAYDPELDRKIALKVIRTGKADEALRQRIVREAQAMAKLSDPNVAQVYEVGEHEGGTFIAMEFVRGLTLRRWSKDATRSWRDVLEVYVQAGRGLAAAHAVGLVHRDFKPDNAIVGRDGRVRVLDFGLARADVGKATADLANATVLPEPDEDALGTPLTRAGSMMGTPAYMAPEQFLGEGADAQSDQFSFCIALWEALHGERPFAGNTRADLAANLTRGKIREPPKETRAPAWVRAVLRRGLATGPAERFATMQELLAALARDPTRRRRRVAAVLAIVALGAAGVGWSRLAEARKVAACEAEGATIEQVWDEATRDSVRAALVATDVSHAQTTAAKVMPWLDERTRDWRAARTQACLSATVEHTHDAATQDKAQWCLEEQRLGMEALVAQLTRADAKTVDNAVRAAASLIPSSTCVDPQVLSSLPTPPSPSSREEARALTAELSRVSAIQAAGKYDEALAIAESVLESAEALGWPPLSAKTRAVQGELLDALGRYEDAEAASKAAYMEAARSRTWDVAADAAIELEVVVGMLLARPEEALTWAGHAEVAIEHAGDPRQLRTARRLFMLGQVELGRGDSEAAVAQFEHALAIREEALGPDHLHVAACVGKLADAWRVRGEYGRAQTLQERALAIYEQTLGSGHPQAAVSLAGLAAVQSAWGKLADAKTSYERAAAIQEKALGAHHPALATTLGNLGIVHSQLGEYEQAEARFLRADAIYTEALEPDHPHIARNLVNLVSVHFRRGELQRAKAVGTRALEIYEKTIGAEHVQTADALVGLANVHLGLDEPEQAQILLERALPIHEKALGPDHPAVATGLSSLAIAYHAREEYARAEELNERALGIYEAALGADHPAVATCLDGLGVAHQFQGEYEEAKAGYERSLAIKEKALGPDHPDLAWTLASLGMVTLELDRPAEAAAFLERAVTIYDATDGSQHGEAGARFALAKALLAGGGDRTRAIALAKAVREVHAQAGPGKAEALAEVERWLEEHAA